MRKARRVGVAIAACVLAMMFAPRGEAQAWRYIEFGIINANYPMANPGLDQFGGPRDVCNYMCAEQFSIGGKAGVYVNRMTLGLVGTNFTGTTGSPSVPITCTFKMEIVGANSNNSVNYPVLVTRSETVVVLANSLVNPAEIPLTDSFGAVYLGPGNYYLLMDNRPTGDGSNCNADLTGGVQANPPANLDWNLDSPSVAGLGPAFADMVNPIPSTFRAVNGTFTFELDGFPAPAPVVGGAFQAARLIVAGPKFVGPGGPVEAQIGFVNALTGNLLAPLQQVTLNPGQIESVDVNLAPFISRLGQRVEVQPVIAQSADPAGAAQPPVSGISATIQMLDGLTGFETELIPVSLPGAPNPGPPQTGALSPQVLAGAQTMRFDVTATQTDPCIAQVSFTDASGNPLIPSVPVNIAPGTGTTVDLNADALRLRVGQGIEVQPVLTVAPPDPAVASNSVCNASVEVFDHVTGRTWSHQDTTLGSSAPPSTDGGTPGVPSSAAGTQ